MSYQETSRTVYETEVKPTMGDKQRVVYVAIQMSKRPVCNQEISDYLNLPINSTTPRTQELVKMGKVKEAFKAKYPKTNRTVIYWQVA